MPKKKEPSPYKVIEFHHLINSYRVVFHDMSVLIEDMGDQAHQPGPACVYSTDKFESTVFINDIGASVRDIAFVPFLAHELVHVLQNICESYQMNFYHEREHMAYMMTHMLMEIQGCVANEEE